MNTKNFRPAIEAMGLTFVFDQLAKLSNSPMTFAELVILLFVIFNFLQQDRKP